MTDSRRIKTSATSDGYVELPTGIFTVDGTWYHTTLSDLEAFSPAVYAKVGASGLFEKASDWARLPATLAVWALPLFLGLMPWWGALVFDIALFVFASFTLPSLVIYGVIPFVRLLNHPFAQGFFYVAVLSYFAAQGAYPAVWTGMALFITMRWQLLNRFVEARPSSDQTGLSTLGTSDRILRNVIVSASIKYGASQPEVERMEKRMIEIATRHKRKK